MISRLKGPSDPHGEAGEYVLGLLSETERSRFEARMARDPALARAVARWEEQLAQPLVEADIRPAEPPADLWSRIDAAIDEQQPVDPDRRPSAAWSFSDARTVAMEALRRRLRRWQLASVVVGGLAVAAIGFLAIVPLAGQDIATVRPLGVLIDMNGRPSWTILSSADGRMVVEPLPGIADGGAATPEGEYVLWAVGEGVRPLGTIGTSGPTVIEADLEALSQGSFAISVEPPGAAGDETLTGEVVYLSM
ncbi:MAG: anti-sigma factor [Azospirillaceae bacterium]